MKIKILLVDDHEIVLDGLRSILEKEPDFTVIATASNGREAISIAKKLKPDVVVMDVNMPGLNGVDATTQLKALELDIKVLTLSAHIHDKHISRMIKAGASGYIPKSSAVKELSEAIRTVANNKTYLSQKVMDSVFQYMKEKPEHSDTSFMSLSMREREILQLIAEGKMTKEISDILNLSESTVNTHRQKIMKKLNLHTIADLTKYAISQELISLNI